MKVVVWGLGYVGTVSAACLAQLGHEVVGVEPHQAKVDAINAGRSPIREPGLEELISEVVKSGRLKATQNGGGVVPTADISLICVGTPSAADGGPNLTYVRSVATEIGTALRNSGRRHTVVVRSTLFPGTTRTTLRELLEQNSGRQAGKDFGLAMNPEFMRETSAINDFFKPPYTVVGEFDAQSGDTVQELYKDIKVPVFRVALEEAEVLKMANNAFHAVKVGFANEIGRVCSRLGIDSHSVMRMVCADTKLNISTAYMKPGFAIGGSCLPKDLRSLTLTARRLGAELPILEGILPSNRLQVEEARIKIHDLNVKRVGFLGLSFKAGTDDLRESPVVDLIRALWQDGIDTVVHDPDIDLATMLGSNREYLERQLPQIKNILRSNIADIIKESQAVVVNQNRPEFTSAVQGLNGRVAVIDLVRMSEGRSLAGTSVYRGLSW
jgi:GDP-mannose 6-dehydrogenase